MSSAAPVAGRSERAWWMVVECACRVLGVSTGVVLCAVGVETLHQGDFHSLAVYLLVSSVCIILVEVSYFLDAILFMCLPLPPDWPVFALWRRFCHVGGFQKFLYYSIMSVVCFLHPVLVWHAVISGSMLLVTAFLNFILSKKDKSDTPKARDPPATERGVSFLHIVAGRRGTPDLSVTPRHGGGGVREEGESVRAMLEPEERSTATVPKGERQRESRGWRDARRQVRFTGRGGGGDPVEREMEEMEGYRDDAEPETTSDTAPMITD